MQDLILSSAQSLLESAQVIWRIMARNSFRKNQYFESNLVFFIGDPT